MLAGFWGSLMLGRLLDRFGDLDQLPSIRFLYLDSDPEALQKATAGTTEVALSTAQVFPMPLQPVASYRRRMLDFLLEWLPRVLADPAGREGREALGLATDLGGYAIMLGGTNGAHLTSFSLIDILTHGRACACRWRPASRR